MRLIAATLALTLSAATAEAKLEIRDIQAAHGQFGPERKSAEYVAGDQVYFRYTVAGLRTDDEGHVRADIALKLTDAKGARLLDQETAILTLLALGGDALPADASIDLDQNFPPGEYEISVEVRDVTANDKASFRRKFTVKATEFALVRVRFSHDEEGTAAAPVGGRVGQNLVVRLQAIGFDRGKGQIDVEMEVEVLDARGKVVTSRPIRTGIRSEEADEVKRADRINLSSNLTLNRPGDFVLRLTVLDKMTGKKVAFESPLKVSGP